MTTNDQVQAAALKPCPFCQSEDLVVTENGSGWPIVLCGDCGAKGPCVDRLIDRSVKRWNDRAASRATPADPALDRATVERCASEAEWEGYGETGRVIAKRIRALADAKEAGRHE